MFMRKPGSVPKKGCPWCVHCLSNIPMIRVRDGAVIPHAKLAQSTDKIDWSNLELSVYGTQTVAKGLVCLPSDNQLVEVILNKKGNTYQVQKGQIPQVKYKVTSH